MQKRAIVSLILYDIQHFVFIDWQKHVTPFDLNSEYRWSYSVYTTIKLCCSWCRMTFIFDNSTNHNILLIIAQMLFFLYFPIYFFFCYKDLPSTEVFGINFDISNNFDTLIPVMIYWTIWKSLPSISWTHFFFLSICFNKGNCGGWLSPTAVTYVAWLVSQHLLYESIC